MSELIFGMEQIDIRPDQGQDATCEECDHCFEGYCEFVGFDRKIELDRLSCGRFEERVVEQRTLLKTS